MKKYILLLVCALAFTACSDDDEQFSVPSDRGTVTDAEGNTYDWVRIGDLEWTTSNAKNGASMCDLTYFTGIRYQAAFSAEEIEWLKADYIPVYGNLMTYAEAVASAPEGWRLPTDEDWKKLERAMGMGSATDNLGWRGDGVADLLRQVDEGTEMGLRQGGVCTWLASYGTMYLTLTNFKELGYYWTSTIELSYEDFEAAYYRKICLSNSSVERQAGKTDKLMSVRWVRDAK